MAAAPFPSDAKPEHWTRENASQLLGYVEKICSHGLNPADYDRDALLWAIEYGSAQQLEQQACESFGLAAGYLANGHVPPMERRHFSIAAPRLDPRETAILIGRALAANDDATTANRLRRSCTQARIGTGGAACIAALAWIISWSLRQQPDHDDTYCVDRAWEISVVAQVIDSTSVGH